MPFFDDLKDSKVYLIDEKKILENLKSQKERPIFYQMVLSFISYHFKDTELLMELSRIFYKIDRDSDGKITIEERHYEWYNTTERVINGGLCYPKYRRTYTEIVGVSKKTNKVVTHNHSTYNDLFDELEKLGYK